MKSGAGDDPFADEGSDETTDGDAATEEGSEIELDERSPEGADRKRDRNDGATRQDREATGAADERKDGADESGDAAEIPWVLRRSRVKEDRDNVHQFFLREEYSAAEDDIMAAVADELDIREKDLKKLDVREAMVATADAEAIAATLSEWGYEYVD